IDDCLDLDGDQERVGKTLGTDALQGKATLPVIHFLREAPEKESARIRELLAGGDDGARGEIREMLDRRGALEYARARAADYAREAAGRLAEIPPSIYRDALENLALFTLRRKR
ncbi:MAG: polyprenyl synthetase family protein, partial [Planctomycetota bacterium]